MQNFRPKSASELEKITDDEPLFFMNEWRGREWLCPNANFFGQPKEFQSFFLGSVLPDETRLMFWMNNFRQIRRPVYVCHGVRHA